MTSLAGGTAGVAAGTKTPIRIGMLSWLSGIGGQTTGPARDAIVAWSKLVNSRGGINGHPVELYVADDGGNESRSVSIARDFVENKHVIAFVYYESGSAAAVANYVKSKNVPIVGSLAGEQLWTQNPMLFPTGPSMDGHFWASAKLVQDHRAKKVATVFCTEVSACQESSDAFAAQAKSLGLEVVYQGRISFTQPDYTAECLQMRNSGAQAVVPITENSSAVRLVQSCARQGFKPTYVFSVGSDEMAKLPELDGSVTSLLAFPWFARSGSPAVDEYVDALRRYAPDRLVTGNGVDSLSQGWIAAKTFEKAAQHVSDNPTSQDILEGLWAMRGETLGGLLPGGLARTYTRNQPTPETYCLLEADISGGRWTAPHELQPVCR